MGYRSEVRSIIYGPPDHIDALITELMLTKGNNSPFELFKDSIVRHTLERHKGDVRGGRVDMLDLTGHGWEWYSSYEDVTAWRELMSLIDEKVDTIDAYPVAYEFIRVGEDSGDTESHNSENADYHLSTSTQITDYHLSTSTQITYILDNLDVFKE